MNKAITIDGKTLPFEDGQTIMDAALAAGVYIPHLCHNPELKPHGSCKLCVVNASGRNVTACTMPASDGMVVTNNTPELNEDRKALVQMLFVEGNHICPACEASGNCQLQAAGYYLHMQSPHFTHFYPPRRVDASHPDIFLDLNRCILCELCVRASRDIDKKNVFGISGARNRFPSGGEFRERQAGRHQHGGNRQGRSYLPHGGNPDQTERLHNSYREAHLRSADARRIPSGPDETAGAGR